MVKRTMGTTEWSLVGLLALLWGGSFFFVEVMIASLDWPTVVLLRVAPAAAVLTLVVYISGHRLPVDWASWRALFIMGLLNNIAPFSFIAWGQIRIESGLTSILNATTPLFTVVLAHWLTGDERMTVNRAVGVLIGLVGVALLVGPLALTGLGLDTMAQAAILGAALCYALAGIHGRRLARLPAPVAAAGMLISSTAVALPLALLFGDPMAMDIGPDVVGAVLGLSLLSTACAYIVYFRVLAAAGATNLLLVTFLIPPIALALGIAFLGERPSVLSLAGMAVIFLGLVLIDGRLLRVWRRVPQ